MRSLLLLLSILLYVVSCNNKSNELIKIAGEAQGTTYHISYLADQKIDYQDGIDSIFRKIDSSLSTYLKGSIISRINNNDSNVLLDDHFNIVFKKSLEVSQKVPEFDITVAPIINAWGFGFSKKEKVDSAMIDSLLQYVGFKKIRIQNNKVVKERPGIMIDFNAIAQGYTVDVIATYLENKGIRSYFIELGGEVKARGQKSGDEYWKVGIDKPNEQDIAAREIESILKLKDQALATSGNYRKFYEENGQKYAHIIDPLTGYPAKNNLLSASVVAEDCMTADAYATAFMVMGFEKSKQFLEENKDLNLEVFFIYDNKGSWETYTSENLIKWMEKVN